MITNNASIHEENIEDLRAAIEHRAAWFALLIQEAKKRGLDIEFARDAIYNCGSFHADVKFPKTDDLEVFAKSFATENVKKIFEMDVEANQEEFNITFNYCPLVAAWRKITDDEEFIGELCDAAMNGDRGIISKYDKFEFHLGDTIAKGCKTCQVLIKKI
ncbi:MAG: L-2-amino-thiazoline-4-carboxylic acid hydrolase [Clostridiaceae bacterium]